MQKPDIGDVIASRSLVVSGNSECLELLVIIGKPKQSNDFGDFLTPYQLIGLGREEVRFAMGVDAVQSLQLAMVMIGADLAYLQSKDGVLISWNGDEQGNLGFS